MPPRSDIESILIIGSGPIVIGQACEFDYSGTQAVRTLKKLGYRVILANSNPATIMTDPEMADATYIEPLTPAYIEKIIKQELPGALLPTMGGQTALNLARDLHNSGVLQRYGVELIGASFDAIDSAEDRGRFQETMRRIGLDVPKGAVASSLDEAARIAETTGFPVIIRPAYTLGGSGGSVAYNIEEFHTLAAKGLAMSPLGEILIEESLIGWKEFELEMMRDRADNAVVVCSIENLDPLGIHTGDSITVAPAQTLTDKEFQLMRNAAIQVMRAVGVESGGSNIQFGIHPVTGRMVVIEMNPRVSRSSALASKATGFPIAKIAAQLAVGMTLGEIPNDITGRTVSAFEPTLDYVVVKIPRWAFEKFPSADRTLGPQMKSIGEVMAIGRTFPEALGKAIRSLETGRAGLGADGHDVILIENIEAHMRSEWRDLVLRRLRTPDPNRLFFIRYALALDLSLQTIHEVTGIDPWFLNQIKGMTALEPELARAGSAFPGREAGGGALADLVMNAKRSGFSDRQIAHLWKATPRDVLQFRLQNDILPGYRTVDTCAAEFEATTPYYYSTFGEANEAIPLSSLDLSDSMPIVGDGQSPHGKQDNRTVVILGSGPNRIGQGIEFDYCCVQATQELRAAGYHVVMINSNPETVSTDYDIADRLYFEPLTAEDVIGVCRLENPLGVALQFGGGTSLKLASDLHAMGIPILGTQLEAINLTEERGLFANLLVRHQIRHPEFGIARTMEEAVAVAELIGYPVLVRPSYVLGGRAMEIVFDAGRLRSFYTEASQVSDGSPILIDRFIEDAFEFDIDAVSDGDECLICGVMQHIEEAGIHSGDSACVLPPYMLTDATRAEMVRITRLLAKELGIVGLLNMQFALRDERLYVLEMNPRASRTVPFVSKATGIPWARIAARTLVGEKLKTMNLPDDPIPSHISVKAVKFPFARFDRISYFLGPEMRSTGEVMGLGMSFGEAFAKAQAAVDAPLPRKGGVFISVNDRDKTRTVPIARELENLGFRIWSTGGTCNRLQQEGVAAERVHKVNEGRPNVVDLIKNGQIHLIINTPLGRESHYDERAVGAEAYRRGIPNITTLSGAWAAIQAITAQKKKAFRVKPLQKYHTGGFAKRAEGTRSGAKIGPLNRYAAPG